MNVVVQMKLREAGPPRTVRLRVEAEPRGESKGKEDARLGVLMYIS